jgi:outer membrane biosynthesis protein TonB
MTFSDLVGFLRTRKGTALSVALHLLVVCWGLFSFSARSVPIPPPEDLVPVDVVSEDNVAKAMQGHKDGDKKNKKALAEKIGDPNPVDDIVGKISTKQPVVADTAPPPTPKTEDKPVEKKPDPPKPVEKKPDPPPKPVAEAKPKDEPKPEEKKPEEKKPDQPKVDPIADAIKKEEKKPPPPKPVAQAAPPPAPPKPKADRVFDQSKIAALLDKRDPTRQAVAGAELNANAALGTSRGHAADNSGTWGSMFQSQVERCWKKPYGSLDQQKPEASFDIRLKRDGTLEAMPVPVGGAATPYLRAYQESALRAIIACQPYNLPPTMFEEWKSFEPVFTDRNI